MVRRLRSIWRPTRVHFTPYIYWKWSRERASLCILMGGGRMMGVLVFFIFTLSRKNLSLRLATLFFCLPLLGTYLFFLPSLNIAFVRWCVPPSDSFALYVLLSERHHRQQLYQLWYLFFYTLSGAHCVAIGEAEG